MTIDEVIQLINTSQEKSLTSLQEWVLRRAWEGKTYAKMASEGYYGAEYLRRIAAELWLLLSQVWGEPISKTNFRSTLEPIAPSEIHQQLLKTVSITSVETPFFFPNGPLPLQSPVYISRSPLEELAFAEINKPGSIIRLQAPRMFGKNSLLLRILDYAKNQDYYRVNLDFQQADKSVFKNFDRFLRWFSANISRELNLESKLDEYWDSEMGSKVSCTLYLQNYILTQIDRPFVLILNDVDQVFDYPEIAQDFFPLLRYWYDQNSTITIWQNLRLVMVYATDVYIPLAMNTSPFQIGLLLKIPAFNLQQVKELGRRYQLDLQNSSQLQSLMELLAGHPYLVQLACYYLCPKTELLPHISFGEFLAQATKETGIYAEHLRGMLTTLQGDPSLIEALTHILNSPKPVQLDLQRAYKLESMGLVIREIDQVQMSCELYRLYFQKQLLSKNTVENNQNYLDTAFAHLEEENQKLWRLCNIDELTKIPNRRCFEHYFESEWRRSTQEKEEFSLIVCDLDFLRTYNDAFGKKMGDFCLQKVAQAIYQCVDVTANLAARYDGDEFAIILPHTNTQKALQLAENIRERVKSLKIFHAEDRFGLPDSVVTVSLGVVSTIASRHHEPQQILQVAHEALHQSKEAGRDRITLGRVLDFRF